MKKKIRLIFSIILLINIVFGKNNKNLIKNSGFEKGECGKVPDYIYIERESGAKGKIILTDKNAHKGKKSLLIIKANSEGYLHPDIDMSVNSSGKYKYIIWAKALKHDIKLMIQLYDKRIWDKKNKPEKFQFASNGIFTKIVNVKKNKWQKFEYIINISEKSRFDVSIQLGITDEGKILLDDISFIKVSK